MTVLESFWDNKKLAYNVIAPQSDKKLNESYQEKKVIDTCSDSSLAKRFQLPGLCLGLNIEIQLSYLTRVYLSPSLSLFRYLLYQSGLKLLAFLCTH